MNPTTRILKYKMRKLYKLIVRSVCSRLYWDTNFDIGKSIMVAGAARSGTTWLADVIASQVPCRIMFEPFNSEMVEAYDQFHYFQYMNPDEQNNALLCFCRKIFHGNIRHRWIDRQVDIILPRYRLIKAIRANLLLGWIHVNFPMIPILFIIRHPCSVVFSRMQLDWWTDKDITPFLSQPKLVEDYLVDKLELIRQANTVEEKHALIWCLNNLVPIQQLKSGGMTIIFYENLCIQPEIEVKKIFNSINLDYHESVIRSMTKPSTTSRLSSAIITGEDKVSNWKRLLSADQINNILRVVSNFGLDYIYGDSATPLVAEGI